MSFELLGLIVSIIGIIVGIILAITDENYKKTIGIILIILCIIVLIISIILFANSPKSEQAIDWSNDIAFEKMIRKALDKSSSEPIYPSELRLIESLYIFGDSLAMIDEDVSYSTDLGSSIYTIYEDMYTLSGEITDILNIKYFPELRTLVIAGNEISDISPVTACSKLTYLDLGKNNIESIDGIENLVELEKLNMYRNKISDISCIGNLSKLKSISFSNNYITNINIIENLINLEAIRLAYNRLFEIPDLSNLKKLIYLNISGNAITDISFLSNNYKLKELYIYNNKISDISSIKDLNLTRLSISNNYISDINILSNLSEQCEVWCNNNPIKDWKPLQHIKNLYSDTPDIKIDAIFDSNISPTKVTIVVDSVFDLEYAQYVWDSGVSTSFYTTVFSLDVPQIPGRHILYVSAKDKQGRYSKGIVSSDGEDIKKWVAFEYEINQ